MTGRTHNLENLNKYTAPQWVNQQIKGLADRKSKRGKVVGVDTKFIEDYKLSVEVRSVIREFGIGRDEIDPIGDSELDSFFVDALEENE